MRLSDFAIGAQNNGFKSKVKRAIDLIKSESASIAVSYSGGKDSQVCLDLAINAIGKNLVFPCFFDCGTQLDDTYRCIEKTEEYYDISINKIKTEPQLIDALKAGNYWGYKDGDSNLNFNFGEFMIDIPAWKHLKKYNLNTQIIGLRAEESGARKVRSRVFGEKHVIKGITYLYPVTYWKLYDVWAYIMSRHLPYNNTYNKLTGLGVPFEFQRVGPYFGDNAVNYGRFVYLKLLDLEKFSKLLSIFPSLSKYT